jgi:hypothetical protein
MISKHAETINNHTIKKSNPKQNSPLKKCIINQLIVAHILVSYPTWRIHSLSIAVGDSEELSINR